MRHSTRTLDKYAQIAVAHANRLHRAGRASWAEVTTDDVLESLCAGNARPATFRVRRGALRLFHAHLAETGQCERNVAASIRPPRVPDAEPHRLTDADVARILDSITGTDPYSLRDRALIETLYASGARIGELIAATVDDLDLTRGVLMIRGKGGRLRPAFLTGQAVAALQCYLSCGRGLLDGDPQERHLFLSQRGTALSNQGAWQAISKRARVLGRHVHPHMLRHTFAVVMLKGGTDMRTLQLLLGHARPETTATYLRLDDEWLRQAHHQHHPRGRG